MGLHLNVLADEEMRREILNLVREQLRPLLADPEFIKAVFEPLAEKMVSRMMDNRYIRESITGELRRGQAAAVREAVQADIGARESAFFQEYRAQAKERLDKAVVQIDAMLGDAVVDQFAERVAARIARRMVGK